MAVATLTAPNGTLSGDPARSFPINTTGAAGLPDAIADKRGQEYLIHFSAIADTNTHAFGRPILSAFCCPADGEAAFSVTWDNDDATGTLTFSDPAAGGTTGWVLVFANS